VSERELQMLLEDIRIVTEQNLANPEQASKMLEEEGLYTNSGELTELYRNV
jgi:hypothetical protein